MDRRQFITGTLALAWRALHELDPHMRARVGLRSHSVELFTRRPHDDVVEVLWCWMPVGVLCLVNGRTVRYDRQMRRVMDTYA